jgi:RNA polymerase sigma-70 factor (ECF subfamily)
MQQQRDENEVRNSSDEELYHRYAPTIFTYILQHAVPREEAEDLTLEVFMAALERNNLSEVPDTEKLAWLRRVAHNKLVDSYRRFNRHPAVTLEHALMQDDIRPSPEQTILLQEEYEHLYETLTSLSALQQQVLRLRYGNELSFAEIAIMLNKREGTVRKILSRTLAALHTLYDQD